MAFFSSAPENTSQLQVCLVVVRAGVMCKLKNKQQSNLEYSVEKSQ